MFKLAGLVTLVAASLFVAANSAPPFSSDPAKVVFDLPLTVECRDVSPAGFVESNPTLKVIEAKFRVSARIVTGAESDVVDFMYIIASPDRKMKFQDYLPNTTLESAVADDQIEITDTTENSKGGNIGATVGYQGVGGGLSVNKGTKHTRTNHYKEIAPRALVIASGTIDHQHGVFFKLKPSRAASLEGAAEFTFLAIVPHSWRAGWCTISCGARTRSKSLLARSSVVPAGVAQSQVGLYLKGDAEANELAEELGEVQLRYADILADQLAKAGLLDAMYDAASTGHTSSLCGVFKTASGRWTLDPGQRQLEKAHSAVLNAQERLELLSE